MKPFYPVAALTLLAYTSCGTSPNVEAYPRPATASEVAAKLPPLKIPVPVSPVDLRTAVLTLPADALAEMSPDGRRNYLAGTGSAATTAGVFDKANRRLELICDNPHVGIDAKSMFFLRLFEDEKGRTIAASHSARPFADCSLPSVRFTRVYRLVNRKWHDITESALSSGIPKNAYFRFDQRGSKIGFGSYVEMNRPDGGGNAYDFGKAAGTIQWRDGAFRKN
jgi:hypothetical protein